MQQQTVLITGASGEVGHGLVERLHHDAVTIVTLDIHEPDAKLLPYIDTSIVGDITDHALLNRLEADFHFDTIYHMAALLSTSAEKQPLLGHVVNVQGTLNLLELARRQSTDEPVRFIFPSSVAVYGVPDLQTKTDYPCVREDQFTEPITMYGVTKLHCEHLGRYFTDNIGQFDATSRPARIDFRGVRFPGLLSAVTLPTGGTSDYGPEMLHAAAQGTPYASFVRPDSTISFMTMPDAVRALYMLTNAPRERLSRHMYNVSSFSVSAAEIARYAETLHPHAAISYEPHAGRQRIIDSWPMDMDDSAARRDWGWYPQHDVATAFNDYLIPSIKAFYRVGEHV
jgi:threonine 3-dehydrogenase